MYRLGQENAYWLRNVSLMKNPHFWCYQVDILVIWPNHEVVILTKFHQNWKKIDNVLLMAHFLASTHSPAQVCKQKADFPLQKILFSAEIIMGFSVNRVSNSITIIASSIIDYFWENVRIFRLIRLFRLMQKLYI